MVAEQRAICLFLRSYPGQWVSGRVIARRAGSKRQYQDDPDWAVPLLGQLVEKGLIEVDAQDHYRLKKAETDRRKRAWISPQVRKILERSGKDFSQVYEIKDSELEELENWLR